MKMSCVKVLLSYTINTCPFFFIFKKETSKQHIPKTPLLALTPSECHAPTLSGFLLRGVPLQAI